MERVKVGSSQIKSVGWDAGSKTLELEFASGGVYQYANVEHDDYNRLLNAKSMGGHFAEFIRGKYEYKKVEQKERKPHGESKTKSKQDTPNQQDTQS